VLVAGVGRAAGWVYPISTLIEAEEMEIVECNVPVKSAAAFFGPMCAPNGLTRYYNPFGNNPVSVCENCQGDIESFCTINDPYAGYDGAFVCMASGNGDVAFVRHHTLEESSTFNTSWVPDVSPIQNTFHCAISSAIAGF
jgi:melanoma-associated antigen p97